MAEYPRDFETLEQYRRRMARRYDEPLTVETDIGKVLDEEPPLPLLFDMGPRFNSRRTERAIQRREEEITRLDQRDNW